MFFGKALLTRMFLCAGRAILRFTACVNKKKLESAVGGCILLLKFMIFGSCCLVIYTVR